MTRGGGGGGMKILRRDPKIFRHPKVGSENIVGLGEGGGLRKSGYFKTSMKGGGGAPKKLNCWRRGLVKFQASSFNIFPRPPLSY